MKLATLLLEMFQKYHQLITWNCTGVHIKLYAFTIIFVQTNWKNMKIWQPCNGETGNPVDLGVLKMSLIDFLALNKGVYQFWCLYPHFYGNKFKNWISPFSLADMVLKNWFFSKTDRYRILIFLVLHLLRVVNSLESNSIFSKFLWKQKFFL